MYNESMCLIHSGEPGDVASARLCVTDMPFVSVPFMEDENGIQGVLGLARQVSDKPNYINLLKKQNVI